MVIHTVPLYLDEAAEVETPGQASVIRGDECEEVGDLVAFEVQEAPHRPYDSDGPRRFAFNDRLWLVTAALRDVPQLPDGYVMLSIRPVKPTDDSDHRQTLSHYLK